MKYSKDAPIFTQEGYFRRFYELMQDKINDGTFRDTIRGLAKKGNVTQLDIYNLLENELYEMHHVSMYNTFVAFRTAKSRFYNNKFNSIRKKPNYEQ